MPEKYYPPVPSEKNRYNIGVSRAGLDDLLLWRGTKWDTVLRLCNMAAKVACIEGAERIAFRVTRYDGRAAGPLVAVVVFLFDDRGPTYRRILTMAGSGESELTRSRIDEP